MESILLKCSGVYFLILTIMGCLTGLPTMKPSSYEGRIDDTIEAEMHSILGFASTLFWGGLANEAILRNIDKNTYKCN